MKEEAIHRTVFRTSFGRGCGLVVKEMNERKKE